MELEVMAGISVEMLEEKLNNHAKKLSEMMKLPKPLGRTVGGAAVGVTGSVINLNSQQIVPVGRMWVLRSVGVFGNDTHTSVAGATADLFAGSMQDENSSDFTSCFASAVTIPYVNTYGNRHVCLYPGENLYALVTGATTGQNLVIVGVVDEWIWSQAEMQHI
jgi:hypothetical protein